MSRHGTTQRDINAKERAKQALILRRKGYTLEEIALQCGYADKSGAFRAIKREIDNIPTEDAEMLHRLEYMRLEYLETVCNKRMEAKENKDPLWSVDRLLKIAERRAQLMGLDVKVEDAANANIVVVREIPQGYLEEAKP